MRIFTTLASLTLVSAMAFLWTDHVYQGTVMIGGELAGPAGFFQPILKWVTFGLTTTLCIKVILQDWVDSRS
jgi:hypothetical protein